MLTAPERQDAVLAAVVAETTTIGLRVHGVDKLALERSEQVVTVSEHPVRVKVASYAGAVVNAQPEYDDVARAAAALRRPVNDVLVEAQDLCRAFLS